MLTSIDLYVTVVTLGPSYTSLTLSCHLWNCLSWQLNSFDLNKWILLNIREQCVGCRSNVSFKLPLQLSYYNIVL